jgi:hypothetical protein
MANDEARPPWYANQNYHGRFLLPGEEILIFFNKCLIAIK